MSKTLPKKTRDALLLRLQLQGLSSRHNATIGFAPEATLNSVLFLLHILLLYVYEFQLPLK